MDLEKLAREWIKSNAPQLCWPDGGIGSDDLTSLVDVFRAVAAQARREGIEEAAKANCKWCSGPRDCNNGTVDDACNGFHTLHWETGDTSTVRCEGERIRALTTEDKEGKGR